ncbi:MAG: MotA/TolQ/ExbB proton channel family protein [Deltaproteobacteria bacterium]|nr:MotA/TolQ/ExbB proton channel family protein [Deltaproteobacteria bacterium]
MTERLALLFDQVGAEWVLWLLLALAVLSVAAMVERVLFLWQNRVPVAQLQPQLLQALERGGAEATALLAPYRGMEAVVVAAGVREMHRGPEAVAEVMAATTATEKQRYEKFLMFLSSLGANAPFVGLLGTVIGILGAFANLKQQVGVGGSRQALIMGSISEALVATAVGLAVAIPAVVAYNQFRTQVKRATSNTEALAAILLAHLKTTAPAVGAHGNKG